MIYNIAISVYGALIGLASLWNSKAARWRAGRANWRMRYSKLMLNRKSAPVVWVHCASLGEFEQGRPVIEAIKQEYPDIFLVLSFFSPSGYEIRKNYPGADAVVYLPLDTASNASDFLDIINPCLTIFIKYEYWVQYLEEMGRRKIPLLMVSAIYREKDLFFMWYGARWRNAIAHIQHFFVQDQTSRELLQGIGIEAVTVSGDTRFDRVLSVLEQFQPVDRLEAFSRGRMIIVAGSTWEKDEKLLQQLLQQHPDLGLVLAPHEINNGNLARLKNMFPGASVFSEDQHSDTGVLIIDNVGMLSRLYHYAHICYVGGGFGAGIHNILEAAVYGKPVIFGPRYEKFREARDLVALGGAFPVKSYPDLELVIMKLLSDETIRMNSGNAGGRYVQQQSGATKNILRYIQEKRLLTN